MSVNNSSDYNYATVSSDGTNLTLSLDGSDTTLAYSTYTTIATLIAQINATGSGWSATVGNTSFNSYTSTEIVNTYGQSCLDTQSAYLAIRNASQSEFKVQTNTGKVINNNYFTPGSQNVYVSYTAGFSTIPEDLKQAVLIMVKYLYSRWQDNSFGILGYKVDDISKYDFKTLPDQTREILGSYQGFSMLGNQVTCYLERNTPTPDAGGWQGEGWSTVRQFRGNLTSLRGKELFMFSRDTANISYRLIADKITGVTINIGGGIPKDDRIRIGGTRYDITHVDNTKPSYTKIYLEEQKT